MKPESKPSLPPIKYLVFKGGGTKAMLYAGVLYTLEELGILKNVEVVAGSSAGGISALLVASGLNKVQIFQELFDLDPNKLSSQEWFYQKLYRFCTEAGFDDGQGFINWFKILIKKAVGNHDATFKEWHEYKEQHPEKNLKDPYFEACNISVTPQTNEAFWYKNPKTCNVKIYDALRASMAYGGAFTPHAIETEYQMLLADETRKLTRYTMQVSCLYTDGGMQNNCPYSAFPKDEMLAIWPDSANDLKQLTGEGNPNISNARGFFSILSGLLMAAAYSQNYSLQVSQVKDRVVLADCLDVGALDFNVSVEKKEALFLAGQYSVIRHLAVNYPEYTKHVYGEEFFASLEAANFTVDFKYFYENHWNNHLVAKFKVEPALFGDLFDDWRYMIPTFTPKWHLEHEAQYVTDQSKTKEDKPQPDGASNLFKPPT